MNIDDFNYYLPKELIAQEPAKPRTSSRLMVLVKDRIVHDRFYNIANYLEKGDVLVLNESKVLRARIKGRKESGGKVELMIDDNFGDCIFKGRIKKGDRLIFNKGVSGGVLERKDNRVMVRFNKKIEDIMDNIGELPLPPYIKKPLKKDSQYQTVYSKKIGSLACPTAGLHFDKNLLRKLRKKGVRVAKVCLHVSWDSFLPVKEKDYKKHKIHGEFCSLDKKDADLINNAKRLFVVGTTTLRTLESFARNGKVFAGKKFTRLFVYPGYKFKLEYYGLITNFHFPRSSLLLLVGAFYGREKILMAYREAIKNRYRFYSLGDAMLLLKENSQPQ